MFRFNIPRIIILIGFVFTWQASIASSTMAQDPSKSLGRDAKMEARMDQGWREVRQYWKKLSADDSTPATDPQIALAPEFFSYYLENSDSPTGIDAGSTAFVFWGNLGDVAKTERAMKDVPYDSVLWGSILDPISNAYYKADRANDYHKLLAQLESRLVEERSRSKLLLRLGSSLAQKSQPQQAMKRFRAVVELHVSESHIQRAKQEIYELEVLNVGQLAPAFSGKTIDGEPIQLSDFRGKVVLLEFWATTCGPCVNEIPQLKELVEQVDSEQFQLIGITNDRAGTQLKRFVELHGNTWPQIQQPKSVIDGVVKQGEILEAYNVYSLPRYFLIDRNGNIAFKELRGDALIDAAKSMISGDRDDDIQVPSASGFQDMAELNFLDHVLEGKRVVMLGESNHGAQEFNLQKNRMIQYLHEKLGYRVLLLESGLGELFLPNFERNGLTPQQMIYGGVIGPWRTQEHLELMRYVQQNDSLSIGGFDVQRSGSSFAVVLDRVYRQLEQPNLPAAIDCENRYAQLLRQMQSNEVKLDSIEEAVSRMLRSYSELSHAIEQNKNALVEEGQWTEKQIAIILKTLENRASTLEYLRQFKIDRDYSARYAARDKAMADNILFLANEIYPDEKIIVSAHNYHISRHNESDLVMGEMLAEQFENELYSIGFFAGAGSFLGNSGKPYQMDKVVQANDIQQVALGAEFEASFQQVPMVRPKDRGNATDWMFEETVINHSFLYLNGKNTLVPAETFDAFVLVKNVTPAKLLQPQTAAVQFRQASRCMILQIEEVQRELGLNAEQIAIMKSTWTELIKSVESKQSAEIDAINQHLNPDQQLRLHQVFYQLAGPMVLASDIHFQEKFEITDEQVKKLEKQITSVVQAHQSEFPKIMEQTKDDPARRREQMQAFREKGELSILSALTEQQVNSVNEFRGTAFKVPVNKLRKLQRGG